MLGLPTQSTLQVRDPWAHVRVGDEHESDVPVHRIWRDVLGLYRTGLHPAIGLCVRHRGRVILDRTVGHVEHSPGESPGQVATPETLFNLFSASKMLTAVVTHALAEDGVLGLDDAVVDTIPEFGRHGKHGIRVRHLLNHTAGIPNMPPGVDPFEAVARGRFPLESLYDLTPVSPPGRDTAYHPVTAWLLLQEIIERRTGRGLREVARERILTPLGFENMCYGIDEAGVPRVAKHTYTGPPTPGFMARIFERTIGTDLDSAIGLSNHPAFLQSVMPSANVVSTGREATRFMQMLLNGGQLAGVRVLRPETVRRAVTETTPLQSDSTFGFPMRYGLGFMMGGDRFSLFGLGTRHAFGHLGFTTVVVYADPTRDLAVSFLNTGKPMLAPGMVRWYWTLQRLIMRVPRI